MVRDESRAAYQEPEHRQRAEAFMLYARGDMASRFPMIRFDITNFTERRFLMLRG